MTRSLVHLMPRAAWERGDRPDDTDGFIHLSFPEQAARTAGRFFADAADLIALCIDPAALAPGAVRVEPAGSQSFPHLYGPLPPEAVMAAVPMERGAGDRWALPDVASTTLRRPPATFEALAAAVRAVTGDLPAPWWIAGGWAIDLAAGRVTRAHGDVDIAIPAARAADVLSHLDGWGVRFAVGGALRPVTDARGEHGPDEHVLWVRPDDPGAVTPAEFASHPGFAELLLERIEAGTWHYRRDPTISLPLAEVTTTGPGALPHLRAEIAALYKCARPVGTAAVDIRTAWGSMDERGRARFLALCARAHPALALDELLAGGEGNRTEA